jgi:hypothetical protein
MSVTLCYRTPADSDSAFATVCDSQIQVDSDSDAQFEIVPEAGVGTLNSHSEWCRCSLLDVRGRLFSLSCYRYSDSISAHHIPI